MRLRAHPRRRVVWGTSTGPADRYGPRGPTRRARPRRIRRWIRIAALLALIGPVRLARVVPPPWRAALAGAVLCVAGVLLRNGAGGAILLPGLLFLLSAPLIPDSSKAARKRRHDLERELASYSTPADRRDLEAILDRYPDDITSELRDILASQALATRNNRFGVPGHGHESRSGTAGPSG
jgi:hypothetical protein